MPMGLLRNAEQFQGQDWEHAGHRIEQDTAEKCQQQRLPPEDTARDRHRTEGIGADLKGALGAILATQGQHTIERRRRDDARRSFGNRIARPSLSRSMSGRAAASISDSSIGKNIPVGFFSSPMTLGGTNSRKLFPSDAKRISNGAGTGIFRRAAANSCAMAGSGPACAATGRFRPNLALPGMQMSAQASQEASASSRVVCPVASSFGAAIGTSRSTVPA